MSHYPDPTPCPGNSHLEHAIKAAGQYDEGYRGMAIEILALRSRVRELEQDTNATFETGYRAGYDAASTRTTSGQMIRQYEPDEALARFRASRKGGG